MFAKISPVFFAVLALTLVSGCTITNTSAPRPAAYHHSHTRADGTIEQVYTPVEQPDRTAYRFDPTAPKKSRSAAVLEKRRQQKLQEQKQQ